MNLVLSDKCRLNAPKSTKSETSAVLSDIPDTNIDCILAIILPSGGCQAELTLSYSHEIPYRYGLAKHITCISFYKFNTDIIRDARHC